LELGWPLPLNDGRRIAFGHISGHTLDDAKYLVPFVEDEHTVFLKTIIPSQKKRTDDEED
jgi:hypothetical protein